MKAFQMNQESCQDQVQLTSLELWFSNSFLWIFFIGQGEIYSDQKEKGLETISLEENHLSSKQV